MIHAFDENLHPVGQGAHWQESWYFNWADPAKDFFGAFRVGFRFARNQIDGLVFAIHEGRQYFAYPALNVPPSRPWPDHSPADGIAVRRMQFTMLEPLKAFRLQLTGRDHFDLHWEAFTPPYDYGGGGPPGVAGNHFEQSGAVRGAARLRGKPFTFAGFGQRDKSWGERDWSGVAGWTWISVHFGEDLAFNVWQFAGMRGQAKGQAAYTGGYVYYRGRPWPVESAEIALRYGARKHEPAGARIEAYSGPRRFRFDLTGRGVFPLAKNGLWLYETFVDAATEIDGVERRGAGVIEHTFHVGRLGYLPRAGEIVSTLSSVFIR